jgi:hypothetical protein
MELERAKGVYMDAWDALASLVGQVQRLRLRFGDEHPITLKYTETHHTIRTALAGSPEDEDDDA